MGIELKKVEILMSTYNGERYVGRQLDSIITQKSVRVHITIRDDGSKDGTLDILRSYEDKYPDIIRVVAGKNIGYKRSFLSLLGMADEADYYAFSDQDDIWEESKLCAAICLINNKEKILYVSNLYVCSPDLKILRKTKYTQKNSSIYSNFTRHRYAGCTYVFDKNLKKIVSQYSDLNMPDESMPSHDSLVCFCAYACGNVVVDDNSYIKHIRYKESVTYGNNGISKKLKHEWNMFFSNRRYSNVASLLLKTLTGEIKNENLKFLEQIASYHNSIKNRLLLCFNKNLTSGNFVLDLKCRMQILAGYF